MVKSKNVNQNHVKGQIALPKNVTWLNKSQFIAIGRFGTI